jgi:hypothetical protein
MAGRKSHIVQLYSHTEAFAPFSAIEIKGHFPLAFAWVVSYSRCMELLTHNELVRMTPPERLALISQLWDSLEDNQLPLTAAQQGSLTAVLQRSTKTGASASHGRP